MAFASDKTKQGAAGVSTGFDIDNSLRFNDDDSAYLSRTPSSAGNRGLWTFSAWVKRGNLTNIALLSGHKGTGVTGNENRTHIGITSNDVLQFQFKENGVDNYARVVSSMKLRDPSAWYHIVAVLDSSLGTTAPNGKVKLYVNGVQVTAFSTYSVGSITSSNCYINNTIIHTLGQRLDGSEYFDGYLAEVHFIDGTALDHTSFGETGDYGEWKPKAYDTADGAYGTNGFYLDFKTSGTLGNDANGSNNWTPTNLASTDQMVDTPTNNFATWNPGLIYYPGYASIFSEGNLKGGHDDNGGVFGSIVMTTGKWYAEMYFEDDAVDQNMAAVFAVDTATSSSNSTIERGISYKDTGDKVVDGTTTSYGATYSIGDIIGIAVDVDAGNVTFYKNNTSQGSTSLGAGDDHVFACGGWNGTWYWVANFGQDSSFAGNDTTTAGPYTDGGGIGDFFYEPPSGFLALCTKNLPDPAVIPSEHFNATARTGTGTTTSTTGIGFQPDFVWTKGRSDASDHRLFDAVRGATKSLKSNTYASEATITNTLTSFDSDGFTFGSYSQVNENNKSYVDWCWKANGAGGTGHTQGTISSTASANADAGFSIVSYTGNVTSGATVGHGLSKKPEMMIIKKRNEAGNHWVTWVEPSPNTSFLYLDTTEAIHTGYAMLSAVPNTTDINLSADNQVNGSGGTYIAYCFHSVDGYSKVGSYTGNGSTDGTFVYTGFRPAYVMVKRTDSSNVWGVMDTDRTQANYQNFHLIEANSSAAEDTGADYVDMVSNGFKVRASSLFINASGGTYIYLAFAESPFKHTNAR